MEQATQAEVVVRRVIRAAPERVYDAWLDAEGMTRWMCPGDIERAEVALAPRVGGEMRIEMIGPAQTYEHHGRFLELVPHRRVAFTWTSKGTEDGETTVTVDLVPVEDGTEVVLTHRKLPPAAREPHRAGWTSIADKLGRHVEG